jgi:hypothetical protein
MTSALASGTPASLDLPGVLAPAAWVAVREYGRRLENALHGYELQEEAEAKKALFDGSYGLLTFAPGWGGTAATILLPQLAKVMGADGQWTNGSGGQKLSADDAAASVPPATAARAREVYASTLRVLGLPVPPTPPEIRWWEPLMDAASDSGRERSGERAKKTLPRLSELAHLIPK